MKKSKIVLTLLLVLTAVFMFVSCDANSSLLDSLVNEADNFNTVSQSYNSNENNSIEDIQLSAVSNMSYTPMELSVSDDLISFNEKRLELIDIHEEILVEIETIKALFESIKTKAETLSDKEYVLLQEDKESIQENILAIKDYRTGLLETKGEAYARIYGQEYTRDNLTDILVMFDEVYEVLEYRLDTLRLAIIELEIINNILTDYMES